MPQKTAVLKFVGDSILAGWSQVPDDGQPKFLKIDEGAQNHDGDTTRIFTSAQFDFPAFRLESLPPDFKTLVEARLRVVAKCSVDGSNLQFAYKKNGLPVEGVTLEQTGGFLWPELFPTGPYSTFFATSPDFPVLTKSDVFDLALVGNPNGGVLTVTALEVEIVYMPNETPFTRIAVPSTTFTKVPTPGGTF